MQFNDDKPIFRQIFDLVTENILSQRWPEDERIPSVRELAVSIEVNQNTILKTYARLEEQEFIQVRRGLGYFVTPGARARILEMQRKIFIEVTAPEAARTMMLLQIQLAEFEEIFKKVENFSITKKGSK